MRRALLIIALILFLIVNSLSVSSQLADTPWPTFRMDKKHSGISPYNTSHVDGTIKWTFKTGAGIESSPVIGTNGTIYILLDVILEITDLQF